MDDSVFQTIMRRKKDVLFMILGVLIGIFFEWNIVEIAIFSVFIWSIIGPIPARYLVWPALLFLIFTPLLMVMERNEQAEEYAIYAYYFLIMAVLRGIVEIRQEERAEKSPRK